MNRLHARYCRSSHWRKIVGTSLVPWTIGDTDLGDDLLEVGSGPGAVTPMLATRVSHVTSVDRDLDSLARLGRTSPGARAVGADATHLPFGDGRFSSVAAFTMLHHVAGREGQRRLLREAWRVLRRGGHFIGCDPRDGLALRLLHVGDTFLPVDHDWLTGSLRDAGFERIEVATSRRYLRWRASRPC